MKYCLRSRLSPRYLKKADEIKVDYRDRKAIPDIYHKYPGKTIILSPRNDFKDDPYNLEELQIYNNLCEDNFIINLNYPKEAELFKHKIKFMLNTEATSYWELRGLEELGATYAYVGIPLFFDLKDTLNFNIQLRAIPTVSYNHILPHKDGICGQWIRPEDVDLYEGYIQALEFESCSIEREQTLFSVYAERKNWSTRLDILVTDLDSPAVNRLIPSSLTEKRMNCRQTCMSRGNCHLCHTILKLADIDTISNKIIEK